MIMEVDFLNAINAVIPTSEDIINQIFPNLWVFIAHIVAAIILFALVIYFAWKPTKKYLEKRKKEIQKDVDAAEQSKLESEKNLEASKQQLLDSKTTAGQIIETAQIEAIDIKNKSEKEAVRKANLIEKQTDDYIRKQEKELSERVNLEVSKLALDTAEIFLGKKIDKEANKEIVDQIVDELEVKYNIPKEETDANN